ncbi:MarR family winged helix-turn-helix transcriptional regulator [Polymorphobacter sp.]|uniref:MarR family winged helix-turn-helix transcriptional regulator n=1 Tax=Polymorphobacter sp. TaxID=1909290 RepID=UPI003F6FD4B7
MNDCDSETPDDITVVMAAGRQIHEAMDRLDGLMSESLGVNRTDLRCLFHLIDKGALTPGDIAGATGLTSGSVTTLIDRLERQGLAERRQGCLDRRSVMIDIPPCERARVETTVATLKNALKQRFAAMEKGQLALMAAALPLFAEVLVESIEVMQDANQD